MVFVTEINFRLMIRGCHLGAPEHTGAVKASTNRQLLQKLGLLCLHAHTGTYTESRAFSKCIVSIMWICQLNPEGSPGLFGQQLLYDMRQPL